MINICELIFHWFISSLVLAITLRIKVIWKVGLSDSVFQNSFIHWYSKTIFMEIKSFIQRFTTSQALFKSRYINKKVLNSCVYVLGHWRLQLSVLTSNQESMALNMTIIPFFHHLLQIECISLTYPLLQFRVLWLNFYRVSNYISGV